MDYARMPTGGMVFEDMPTKKIEIENITLDLFMDAFDSGNFGFLQGGFRRDNDRCPVAAVVDAFEAEQGKVYVGVSWPSYSYMVGIAHGSDGDPRKPEQPFLCPDNEWVDGHYDAGYDMGTQVREAMIARGVLKDIAPVDLTGVEEKEGVS